MAVIIEEIEGWWKTAWSFFFHPAAAKIGDTPALLILSQARDFGPSPKTGGVLHAVNPSQAVQIGSLISDYAPKYGLDVAEVIAGMQGESRCDPRAINPNFQHPAVDALDRFRHTDIGIAQFDGAILLSGTGMFSDLKGLSPPEIMAKAFDPTWAIPKFCEFLKRRKEDVQARLDKDPTIIEGVPNRDVNILVYESYNVGVSGGVKKALTEGLTGDWTYGKVWLERYAQNKNILSGKEPMPTQAGIKAVLVNANTHQVGLFGLIFGSATVIAAVVAFFKLLADPKFLIGILQEHGYVLGPNTAKLYAAVLVIFGAIVVSLLSAYFGRPKTIASGP